MLSIAILAAVVVGCLAKGPELRDCHPNGNSAVVLSNTKITPYPPKFPGKVNITFDLEVKRELKDFDLQVKLVKDLDGFPIQIPCIDGVGSCLYEDMCTKLAEEFPNGCPPELPQCKCPFKPVKREVRNLQLELPAFPPEIKDLVAGKLEVNLELQDSFSGDVLSCLDIKLELATN